MRIDASWITTIREHPCGQPHSDLIEVIQAARETLEATPAQAPLPQGLLVLPGEAPWRPLWQRLRYPRSRWRGRVQLLLEIVGRRSHDGQRMSLRTAWQVACIVYDRPRQKEKTV